MAIRLALPDIATVDFVDALQGSQSDDVRRTSGDFVLRRRDGIYAYHLAVVVDDAAQGITEVVRGADLLSSTGRHILLQQALGVPTPRYCHLPLALDGRGLKLSKSSQSLAVDPKQASPLLWRALASLRQTPPPSLQAASLAEIWAWAVENWSLDPLQGLLSCPAPAAGLAITSG
jgi:glutamyl-Q tRNA(Asp) synthetase